MKHTTIIICLLLILGSCNKIELDTENNKDVPTKPTNPTDPSDPTTIATVQNALEFSSDTTITLKGFIVGFILGNSINKGARFSIPTDEPNTNFLLADDVNEKEIARCLAVKLEKSGTLATRKELNLYDHPELFHKNIILNGNISSYFSKNGITRIFNYKIVGNEGEDQNQDSTDSLSVPNIEEEEQYIPQGRNLDF